ncbi:MAG: hypothetical protein J6Q51_00710 [Clostridia bacterium]|nr:hypothetical protein [Clostridia bacterium]
MFRTLKKWLLGEPQVDEVCKQIAKDKKLSPQQKIETILEKYQQYFAKKFAQDVNLATYEMHYEQFMQNDKKNEYTFKLCYNEEKNNLAFCQVAMLSKYYKQVASQGIDKQALSHQQNRTLLLLEMFDKEFARINYDGTLFYSDLEVQTNLLKITYRVVDCLQENQAENTPNDNQQTNEPIPEI